MKKLALSIVVLFIQLIAFAQTPEVEPNNSFGTASPFLVNDPTIATLGGVDTVDYHGLDFDNNANFYLVLNITNTGTIGTQQIDLSVFNSLNINGQYVGNFYSTGYQLFQGDSFTDTIKLCGLAKDSFYLQFKSNGEFEYTMEWFPVNTYNADDLVFGYNNTPATASPFSFGELKEASIAYTFWGNYIHDSVDYFTTTLPAANYDSVGLKIQAQSNSCSGLHGMQYFCYKNGNPTPFASGYVGNNTAVNSYQTVFTTVSLNNMQQGDVLLVKYIATSAFGYKFEYKLLDEFEPDGEDNCCTYNAIPVVENEVFTGNVGEYDFVNNEFVDEFDTYRIILPQDGAINLFIKARNDQCTNTINSFKVDILDTEGNSMEEVGLLDWFPNPTCGQIKLDTIKIRGSAKDTFYLRLKAYEQVSYNIKYQLTDSTDSDANESYNNPVSTVLPIAVGQVKKGHIRFKKTTELVDASDIYVATLPANGSIRVFLKATYRGNSVTFNNPSQRLELSISGQIPSTPANPPFTNITPDQIYLDTFLLCGLAAGTHYFVWNSTDAYEYEFRYEIVDSSSNDNDVEPNNTPAQATTVGGAATKKGHLRYRVNVTTDLLDYYKMVYTSSDSLIIYLQATNTSCVNGKTIVFNGADRNLNNIFNRTKTNVPAGQTVYDSAKVFINGPDSVYLEIYADAPFKYEFTTNGRKPTSNFTITGDSTVCYSTQAYTATNIGNETVTYNWSLPNGGGSLTFVDSVATVTWNNSGTRKVQLFLTNTYGNSATKQMNVVVDATAPILTPAIINFARTLSITNKPTATVIQWYRNGSAIANATDSVYYAALAGTYTAKFVNNCGIGPISNSFNFPNDAIVQTITFPHIPTQSIVPNLKIKLPATASSGLPVFYTLIYGYGSITQDSLSIYSPGDIIIKASQPGDDFYSAATSKYDTITVVKGNQLISFNPISNRFFRNSPITLNATTTSGLSVFYSIVSGNATATQFGNVINLTGAGNVTVRASQPGNFNYNAATPVEHTFCVGVDTLNAISGAATACQGTYIYTVQKIPGANFVWTLSGGGTMTTNNDTAFVTWQNIGTQTLKVKANSACNTTFSFEPQKTITISNVIPTIVSYMLPVNGAINQTLPLSLSWVPGVNTETYDLYVWDSATAQPGTPYKTNLTTISYTIPQLAFAYNTTYKWRVVSKNPCNQVSGPIQTFRLIPLPDLQVTNVAAPTAAISGQNITISWTVKNNGPGNTPANKNWEDAVYLTFDTLPNFSIAPEITPYVWSVANFPVRALLLGTKPNAMALQAGEQYTNSINFNIPLSYSLPLYAYVITNGGNNVNTTILEVTKANDTLRAVNPINITLAPAPDLRVDSIFTPSSTFSGSVVNIAYKVKNYGALTPAGAYWLDNAYISQSVLFDSANALKLYRLNGEGSYYPNAPLANNYINTQLQQDSFYFGSFTAVIPNYIFGTWFIHLKTNNDRRLYEGTAFTNNINYSTTQVYLTPTPQLKINALNLPITQASTTQPIGLNWNIYNNGFNDNIERNRGHYYRKIGDCIMPCSAPPGQSCVGLPGMILHDSTTFGGSYWKDRVYISTDSSGLNTSQAKLLLEIPHGIENSGLYIYEPYGNTCVLLQNPANLNKNTKNVINPGSNFPKAAGFIIPDTLAAGTYYIYVWVNANKTVFEYPGTPEIKRTVALIVQRPDAVVSSISSPANAIAGQAIQINYAITNNGLGAVYNHIRRDRIYVSTSPVFDGAAVLFATNTFTEDLPVGTAVPHTVNYILPPAFSGTRYFYVRTNLDSAFRETNANNNTSAAATTIYAPANPADLIVSNVQTADTVTTVFNSIIQYTVVNSGTGAASGSRIDSLFVSCSPTFTPASAFYIGKKTQANTVVAGGNFTDTVHVKIPFTYYINNCFTQNTFNNGYFFVKTNANGGIYEGVNTTNNIGGSGVKILDNPLVDHIVTFVTGADSAIVGRPYRVDWAVKNIGRNPVTDYGVRYDSLYISVDSVLNTNAIFLGNSSFWSERLFQNQNQNLFRASNFVNLPSGFYYVLVKTNANKGILAEKNFSNNVNLIRTAGGAAKRIWVTRPILPDLTDSIISAPTSIAVGQPITIVHRIKNVGNSATYPGSFYHYVAIANDVSGTSILSGLSDKNFNIILQPGQYKDDTVYSVIPINTVPRNYVIYSKSDSYNQVTEIDENNNASVAFINIYRPDPSDLIVQNVTALDTVLLGYKMDSARWQINNNSGVSANGFATDGMYLSQNTVFDSTAILIGISTRNFNLPPLDVDTFAFAPLVTGVTEGFYHMFVRTDILNQLPETDDTNNTNISAGQVYVKVKELQLNVLENNTLATDNRFYKLIIPDTLNGATISVKLTSNDSLTRINQMFIGKGYVPTAAHFDYTYPNANYGNQEIVMAYATAGTYYITVRAVNPAGVIQNITLLAKKLPFAISNVQTGSGGNIGNVTVKISGSLFTAGMTAKLNKPGTEIIASAVYYTNTTVVYATFNLQGKPLGIYDVTLSKADTAFAMLANGFSVVSANNGGVLTGGGNNTGSGNGNLPGCDPGAAGGLNTQLITELLVPEYAFAGWPFLIQINYSNPTNFDLPAQVRTLYAENIIKMALTPQGAANGVQTLTLELTGQDGPPGIIRAGGSGTIFIYGKTAVNVAAHTITLFRLL